MRILVGLFVACSWLGVQTVDAKPHAKRPAAAKKVKAAGQKRTAAKAAEAPAETPAPPPPVHTERAKVTQIVDSEEPEVRKRK